MNPEFHGLIEAGNKMLDKLKRTELRNTELERRVSQLEREYEVLRRYLPTVMELADIGDEEYVAGIVVHEESIGADMTGAFRSDKRKFITNGGMVDFLAILLAAAQANKEVQP
jgi:hypothetical protein